MSGIVGDFGAKSYFTKRAPAGAVSSATAPINPQAGLTWFNTVTGITYLRAVEGTDAFWMEISATSQQPTSNKPATNQTSPKH